MKYLGSILFILLVLIILPFPGIKSQVENFPDIKLIATMTFMINGLGYAYLSTKNNAMSLTFILIHLLLSLPLISLITIGQQAFQSFVELIAMLSFVIGQLVFILAFIQKNQI